jgi:hypothetical protein
VNAFHPVRMHFRTRMHNKAPLRGFAFSPSRIVPAAQADASLLPSGENATEFPADFFSLKEVEQFPG